jgi:dihydrofolate reductase
MRVSLIVAMDQNRGIGKDNRLPWRLSADLKNFKSLTMGHHLIVGRITAQSIGRPLPGREGIVLTRARDFALTGWQIARTLEDALEIARKSGETEAFIGGGASVYTDVLPLAHRIYLTRVHTVAEADIFFRNFDESKWEVIETWDHPADEKNEFPFTFQVLSRRKTH